MGLHRADPKTEVPAMTAGTSVWENREAASMEGRQPKTERLETITGQIQYSSLDPFTTFDPFTT